MTNYRTMMRGTTEYGTATGKSVALSAFYQNSSNGVFGFLTATRMWNKNPFVSIQSFDGDWLINGLMLCPNHSSSWLVNGNIETMLPFTGGMFKLYANWLQHDREMFTGDVLIAIISCRSMLSSMARCSRNSTGSTNWSMAIANCVWGMRLPTVFRVLSIVFRFTIRLSKSCHFHL